jgi:hypothetical protein
MASFPRRCFGITEKAAEDERRKLPPPKRYADLAYTEGDCTKRRSAVRRE